MNERSINMAQPCQIHRPLYRLVMPDMHMIDNFMYHLDSIWPRTRLG